MLSIARTVFLLVVLTVPAAAIAQTELPADGALLSWTGTSRTTTPGIVATRTADVNLNLLRTGRAAHSRLDFGPGRSFAMTLEPMESGSGAHAWKGTIDGHDHANVLLVEHDGLVSGTIQAPAATYAVRPAGPGRVEVLEIAEDAAFGNEMEPLQPPASWVPPASGDSSARTTDALDVLVLYTPDARTALGGEAAAQVFAEARIAELNLTLANSDIALRAHLAKASVISYTETGISNTDLARLQNDGDGYLDAAHSLRDQCGADVVTLLVHSGGSIGYLMTNPGPYFASYAFTVVTVDMAAFNKSMSHEIGHNLGSAHDRANADIGGAFAYSYGYRVPGEFRTVMAYPCSMQGQPSCPRQFHFSNPDGQFGGLPTGVPIGDPLQADNATGFDAVADIVTAFRPSAALLCKGQVVTIEGTDAGERITGTEGADVIDGKGGNDIISALEGDDIVCAGSGDDIVYGGDGDDVLVGGTGNDRIYGGDGNDILKGQAHDDELNGGKGADIIEDGNGDDLARGGPGWDRFRPGAGNDTFIGGGSPDWIDFIGATEAITIDLAAGTANGPSIGSDTVSEIERVRGTYFADTIYGDALENYIKGGAKSDLIFGMGGNDTIFGNGGDDQIFGNAGHDTLSGGYGFDTVDGGLGTDVCDAEIAVRCE